MEWTPVRGQSLCSIGLHRTWVCSGVRQQAVITDGRGTVSRSFIRDVSGLIVPATRSCTVTVSDPVVIRSFQAPARCKGGDFGIVT